MEFKTLLLKDLTKKINSGSTPRGGKDAYKEDGLIKLIRSQNIYNHQFAKEGLVFISEDQAEKLKNVIVKKNDILLNITGDSVARCTIVEDDMLPARVNQHVMIVRVNEEELNPYFLLAYLTSKSIQNYLLSISQGGGTRAALTKRMVECLEIPVPSLQIQALIAANLKSINEKIKININTIENLEKISVNLFKNWFVDFEFPNEESQPYKSSGGKMIQSELGMIPEGWYSSPLKHFLDNVKETTKPGFHLQGLNYTPIDAMPMKSLIVKAHKDYREAKSSLLLYKKHDILLGAMRVYFHRVNLAFEPGVTRSTSFVLRSKRKEDLGFILLQLFQDSTIKYADRSSKGSTMPYAVWDGGLGEMLIPTPPEMIRGLFTEKIMPLLDLMYMKTKENQNLENLRGTLLPKLLSGEIEVPVKEPESV